MREILFRGKSENGSGWVEGSLRITTIQPADDAPFKHYEIEDTTIGVFPNDFMSGICKTVDPETVGQYTGMTDKNGRKIFEGDVVKETDVVHNGEIQIRGKVFSVSMRKGCWVVIPTSDTEEWDFLNSYLPYLEVIGNIHDNPELMEVNVDG